MLTLQLLIGSASIFIQWATVSLCKCKWCLHLSLNRSFSSLLSDSKVSLQSSRLVGRTSAERPFGAFGSFGRISDALQWFISRFLQMHNDHNASSSEKSGRSGRSAKSGTWWPAMTRDDDTPNKSHSQLNLQTAPRAEKLCRVIPVPNNHHDIRE